MRKLGRDAVDELDALGTAEPLGQLDGLVDGRPARRIRVNDLVCAQAKHLRSVEAMQDDASCRPFFEELIERGPVNRWLDDAADERFTLDPSQKLRADVFRNTFPASEVACLDAALAR
jgi:hypothetical protein